MTAKYKQAPALNEVTPPFMGSAPEKFASRARSPLCAICQN